jgi:RNA polymerase sigma-70 factor (ECF subfamily)
MRRPRQERIPSNGALRNLPPWYGRDRSPPAVCGVCRVVGGSDRAIGSETTHAARACCRSDLAEKPRSSDGTPAGEAASSGGTRRLDPDRLGDHLDRLYRAAWALCGSREAAEDLVQDTYARVLSRPRFLRHENDLGYLLRVLRNTFLSSRRTASRRPVTQPFDESAEPADERSEWRPERAAETHLVYEAIAGLSVEYREVIVAVDVVGLSYGEAARVLRLREGTVTSRLFRARQQVARQLSESGSDPGQKRGSQ